MSEKLPDINQQFAEWYQAIVHQAELADHAPVRGCMVIRPMGMLYGNILKIVLINVLKKPAIKMLLFHC